MVISEDVLFESFCQELEKAGLDYGDIAASYGLVRSLAKDLHSRFQMDTQALLRSLKSQAREA